MRSSLAIVKVGGSLYDLPDLGPRLQRWLVEELPDACILLIPGGGPVVEALRDLDRCHKLGEETSHWLALRALSLNAHFLAALLPSTCVVNDVAVCRRAWENNQLPILDVHEFARADENNADHLPHCWRATSDAIAARVAVVMRAQSLILLKSRSLPDGVSWEEAGQLGWVDPLFPAVLHETHADLLVRSINLRSFVACSSEG